MAQTGGTPSKLIKLREWLELADAAKYLSAVWGEDVSEADVLRLGLDRKLTLSVHLVNLGSGRAVDIIPLEAIQWEEGPNPFMPDTIIRVPDSEPFNDAQAIRLRKTQTAEKLDGVFDLPMIGAEALEVEHAYQTLIDGTPVELTILAGCFVQRDGCTYQLLERWPNNEHQRKRNAGKPYMHLDWFLPAQTFPAGTAIIVRTAALRALESFDASAPPRWPWGDYTTGLLNQLADAARKFWRLYDPADPSTAPTNEQVIEFLRERGVAQRTAEVMATILRADGLPTGPRK